MMRSRSSKRAGHGPTARAIPYWPFLNAMLADLRTRRGDDPAQTRRMALEGLRGHVWQVLLQPDPISARRVARDAALAGTKAAVWFLGISSPPTRCVPWTPAAG